MVEQRGIVAFICYLYLETTFRLCWKAMNIFGKSGQKHLNQNIAA